MGGKKNGYKYGNEHREKNGVLQKAIAVLSQIRESIRGHRLGMVF